MEDKVKYELRTLPIPQFLYKRNDLTLVATKTYSFIHAYINPFYFGNEHLAEMFGCSTQAISDAIKLLQEKKLIHCSYKSKPTGGRFRLVIDDYSDNKQMTNGVEKDEAATSHLLIDKDIKDNNIKGKILENSDNLSELKERLAAKHEKQERKGSRPSYNTQAPSPRQPYMKKERRIADGRHIL